MFRPSLGWLARRIAWAGFVAVLMLAAGGLADGKPLHADTPHTFNFHAHLQVSGASHGAVDYTWAQVVDFDVDGTLQVNVTADGAISGQLTEDDGTQLAVTGQSNGVAVTLVLTMPGDWYLFASGGTSEPLATADDAAVAAGDAAFLSPTGTASGIWQMCGPGHTNLCPE